MDPSLQSEKAQARHAKMKTEGKTCIDCHFGIAHNEPEGPGAAGAVKAPGASRRSQASEGPTNRHCWQSGARSQDGQGSHRQAHFLQGLAAVAGTFLFLNAPASDGGGREAGPRAPRRREVHALPRRERRLSRSSPSGRRATASRPTRARRRARAATARATATSTSPRTPPSGRSPTSLFTRHSRSPTPDAQSGAVPHLPRGRQAQHWAGSQHQSRDVACTNCHAVHAPHDPVLDEGRRSPRSASPATRTERAQIAPHLARTRSSTGKMACSDCHNPHGSTGPKLLVKNIGQRDLLHVPRREARPVPLGARAGRRRLHQLPHAARLDQHAAAQGARAVAVPGMP